MLTYLIQSKLPTAILQLLAMLLIISNSSTYKLSYYKGNKLRKNNLYINNNSLGINDRPKNIYIYIKFELIRKGYKGKTKCYVT
jgi:hypothetical protein